VREFDKIKVRGGITLTDEREDTFNYSPGNPLVLLSQLGTFISAWYFYLTISTLTIKIFKQCNTETFGRTWYVLYWVAPGGFLFSKAWRVQPQRR